MLRAMVCRRSPKVDEEIDQEEPEETMPQNATGSDSRGSEVVEGESLSEEPLGVNQGVNHALIHTPQGSRSGWRVCVDLVNERWRYESGSSKHKKTGSYRPLAQVPGGEARRNYAKANSERQRAARSKK